MKVLVRTDASVQLGAGHVMRCLTLAAALREKGATVVFVCRAGAGDLCDHIGAAGFAVHRLPPDGSRDWHEDAAQSIEAVGGEAPADWLIVDHYGLDTKWESALRPYAKRIAAIDDRADRAHDCDLLIDQNYHAEPEARYAHLVPPACTRLLGPRFALLRPEFSAARPAQPRSSAQVQRVFVFLSGADPANVTGRVLEALDAIASPQVEVDVAVGQSGRHIHALTEYCASRTGWRLHVQTPRIPQLLAAADLAIGAAGGATWERACMGVPSLVLALAENQLAGAAALARDGAHLYLGRPEELDDSAIRRALLLLFENQHLRYTLAHQAYPLTDGRGALRVVRRLLPDAIGLRLATAADSDLLFAWRNDPRTRRYFFDSSPLSLPDHRKWLAETLASDTRVLLIGLAGGIEVGALRYDLRSQEARVSIYLDPARQREGLGPGLLAAGAQWLRTKRSDVRAINAEVLPANEASMHAFLAAGFREHYRCLRLELATTGSSG